MKHIGKVQLQFKKKTLYEIDKEVGLFTVQQPIFGMYVHEWASSNNNHSKEKKPPETCLYWNIPLASVICAEVDLHINHIFLTKKELDTIPVLDYSAPGFDSDGVTMLVGGDHSDTACPISVKINFTSPQERKKLNNLNYQYPTIPIASIDCSKDTYEILNNTIMPNARRDITFMKGSSVVVVYKHNHEVRR
eukprot:scaffold334841_cov28-Attheya_sp.AAC.1